MLPFSFFITAILYAAVGFGGGSTYSALLALMEIDYRILPTMALLCNLIVVSGGAYRFFRAGYVDLKRILPWIITSVPAALLGGYLEVSETLFIGLLGSSLLAAGMRMLWLKNVDQAMLEPIINRHRLLPPVIGAALGLLSGLVGIGGGIFLAPILHLLHWDKAKKIAATCNIFIFVNSLSGLAGQITKLGDTAFLSGITIHWMLFPAVLIGGQIGSYMGVQRLNPNALRLLTAWLILYVSARLLWRWWSMI